MEFCPTCGSMLLFKFPTMDHHNARFSCPTCPYTCQIQPKVRLDRHVRLLKKPTDPIFSEDDSTHYDTADTSCPQCNHGKAKFTQAQTRSADEPMTNFYSCLNCKHTWKED